jgi:chromosome segregation ATPase
VLWTKRCKDPALVGTVKEVIPQISHSKKWPRAKVTDERGKTRMVNSYSLLQDRYFEHMKASGYDDIQRGERDSTAEHLDVLDYKIQQDVRRFGVLDNRVEKREAKIEKLDEKIAVKEKARAPIAEVNAMGKPGLLGGVHYTDDESAQLKKLAKKSVGIDKRADEYRQKIMELEDNIRDLNGQIRDWKNSYGAVARDRDSYKQNYNRLLEEVKPYLDAIRKFPQQLLAFVRTLFPQKSKIMEVSK